MAKKNEIGISIPSIPRGASLRLSGGILGLHRRAAGVRPGARGVAVRFWDARTTRGGEPQGVLWVCLLRLVCRLKPKEQTYVCVFVLGGLRNSSLTQPLFWGVYFLLQVGDVFFYVLFMIRRDPYASPLRGFQTSPNKFTSGGGVFLVGPPNSPGRFSFKGSGLRGSGSHP